MTELIQQFQRSLCSAYDALEQLPGILDQQIIGQSLAAVPLNDRSNEWAHERAKIENLLKGKDDQSVARALQAFVKIVEHLVLYAPILKGLQDVHAFTCERLEWIVFNSVVETTVVVAAAYLYGQAMVLSPLTEEAVLLTVENLLMNNDPHAVNLVLAIFLGVEQSNPTAFENRLEIIIAQIEAGALRSQNAVLAREALGRALRLYIPSDRPTNCQLLLATIHTLLRKSLALCRDPDESKETKRLATLLCCFIIKDSSVLLRMDLTQNYSDIDAQAIFDTLTHTVSTVSAANDQIIAFCGALPILTTWDTALFCSEHRVDRAVEFMLAVPNSCRQYAMNGLGDIASVVLDLFEPFLEQSGQLALEALRDTERQQLHHHAQTLLGRLLAALGPVSLDIMIQYLRSPPKILLENVDLLKQIATLLPNLSGRIITTLLRVIDRVMTQPESNPDQHLAALSAVSIFPLEDPDLLRAAQRLVLWSLNEERGRNIVIAALPLATIPQIASSNMIKRFTFRAAQLLLAEDPRIVHIALSVLSNPLLARTLDERSCSMVLLALHQSLDPSIQIVAAKLLTHLTTAHCAIVQPLAWSHIRQSLTLMDFLRTVDPKRATVEACIISNLLPALPKSLHKKYAGPVKELILSGLQHPNEGHSLSLIFQGLANLAKFEGWDESQQSALALDLLDMAREVPTEAQHAALHAISRLFSVPQSGLDTYEILNIVHATFGSNLKLDTEVKALVAGIYGHLGSIERNPVISRDSRAAINRETDLYDPRTVIRSKVAEVRDKSGAASQTHINCLVAKTLMGTLDKSRDERAFSLNVLTSLSILQPHTVPGLLSELPEQILRDLRVALGLGTDVGGVATSSSSSGLKDTAAVAASVIYLASSLHLSPVWLHEYWSDTAEMFVESIAAGDPLPVLKGLEVVLSGLKD